MPCTGADKHILRLVASIADGAPGSLGDRLAHVACPPLAVLVAAAGQVREHAGENFPQFWIIGAEEHQEVAGEVRDVLRQRFTGSPGDES